MKFYIKYLHGKIGKEATIEANCKGDAMREFAEKSAMQMKLVEIKPLSEFTGKTTDLLPFGFEFYVKKII